jgi:hypothetical protein
VRSVVPSVQVAVVKNRSRGADIAAAPVAAMRVKAAAVARSGVAGSAGDANQADLPRRTARVAATPFREVAPRKGKAHASSAPTYLERQYWKFVDTRG